MSRRKVRVNSQRCFAVRPRIVELGLATVELAEVIERPHGGWIHGGGTAIRRPRRPEFPERVKNGPQGVPTACRIGRKIDGSICRTEGQIRKAPIPPDASQLLVSRRERWRQPQRLFQMVRGRVEDVEAAVFQRYLKMIDRAWKNLRGG